jgi:phenylpropionate dioxygenase-like ring-hydroxylating dioxygenase large terminal subunit
MTLTPRPVNATRALADSPERLGWLPVIALASLPVGAVVRLDPPYHSLIAYRGESGKVRVVDGRCPHMSADLAQGGAVKGDTLMCRYHGWCWRTDGSPEVLYRPGAPQVRLGVYKTDIFSGTVHIAIQPEVTSMEAE